VILIENIDRPATAMQLPRRIKYPPESFCNLLSQRPIHPKTGGA